MNFTSATARSTSDVFRDFVGYGRRGARFTWPNGARLAVSFVINYEEGAENSILDGQERGESLGEVPRTSVKGERDLAMESTYEYGSRAGVWRLFDLFDQHALPVSIYACAVAVERNPDVARYIAENIRHELVCHGLRWEEVASLSEDEERTHISLAVSSLTRTTGRSPVGWYCRYAPSVRTRRLLIEHGGFEYDCDSYSDDVPFIAKVDGHRWCVVPHAFDTNDLKFWRGGMSTSQDFFDYLRDTFDVLFREGATSPKMMTVSLHCRVAGRPGRAASIEKFIEYIKSRPEAWVTTRSEIAKVVKAADAERKILA